MRRVSIVFAMTLLMVAGVVSNAAEPVTQFDSIGTVDAIDSADSTIVVNDVQTRLATYTSVRGLNGEAMTLAQVVPGMKVGLTAGASTAGTSKLVSEIWVLPEGYEAAESEE